MILRARATCRCRAARHCGIAAVGCIDLLATALIALAQTKGRSQHRVGARRDVPGGDRAARGRRAARARARRRRSLGHRAARSPAWGRWPPDERGRRRASAPRHLRAAAARAGGHQRRALRAARRGPSRDAARRPRPRARRAFYGGVALIAVVLVSPLATLTDELFWAHMVEHLLIADLGALLLVLGLTGPVLAPILRIGLFDRLRVLAHPLVALPLWAIDLYAWHVPALLRGRAAPRRRARAAAPVLHLLRRQRVDVPASARCPSRRGSATGAKLGYIIAVRLRRRRAGQRVPVRRPRVSTTPTRAGEAAHGISPRRRPDRRRRDHDGRGVAADDRPLLLAVPARGARERRAPGAARPRRARAASSSTKSASRGRSRGARGRAAGAHRARGPPTARGAPRRRRRWPSPAPRRRR